MTAAVQTQHSRSLEVMGALTGRPLYLSVLEKGVGDAARAQSRSRGPGTPWRGGLSAQLDGVFEAEPKSKGQDKLWEAGVLSAHKVAAVQAPGPSPTAALSPTAPVQLSGECLLWVASHRFLSESDRRLSAKRTLSSTQNKPRHSGRSLSLGDRCGSRRCACADGPPPQAPPDRILGATRQRGSAPPQHHPRERPTPTMRVPCRRYAWRHC